MFLEVERFSSVLQRQQRLSYEKLKTASPWKSPMNQRLQPNKVIGSNTPARHSACGNPPSPEQALRRSGVSLMLGSIPKAKSHCPCNNGSPVPSPFVPRSAGGRLTKRSAQHAFEHVCRRSPRN